MKLAILITWACVGLLLAGIGMSLQKKRVIQEPCDAGAMGWSDIEQAFMACDPITGWRVLETLQQHRERMREYFNLQQDEAVQKLWIGCKGAP